LQSLPFSSYSVIAKRTLSGINFSGKDKKGVFKNKNITIKWVMKEIIIIHKKTLRNFLIFK